MTNSDKRSAATRTARQPKTASQAREEPEVSFLYFRSAGSGTFRVVVLGGNSVTVLHQYIVQWSQRPAGQVIAGIPPPPSSTTPFYHPPPLLLCLQEPELGGHFFVVHFLSQESNECQCAQELFLSQNSSGQDKEWCVILSLSGNTSCIAN